MGFLEEIGKELDLPPDEKEQVLEELGSHLKEIEESLVSEGFDQSEAEQEAARRLGNPPDIARRLQAVHLRAGWRSTGLAVLPFALLGLHSMYAASVGATWAATAVGLVLGSLLTLVGVRELAVDRRPVWLPGFLVIGSCLVFHIPLALVAIWALRRSWGWLVAALTLGLGYPAVLVMHRLDVPVGPWLVLLTGLGSIVIFLSVSVRLFAQNPYSRSFQGSFFVYAVLSHRALSGTMEGPGVLSWTVALTLLALVTVSLYCRSGSPLSKVVILAAGTWLAGFPRTIETFLNGDPWKAILDLPVQALWIYSLVSVPAWYAEKDPEVEETEHSG